MKHHYTNFEKLDDDQLQKEFGTHIHSIIESLMKKIGEDDIHLKNYSLNALNEISNYPLMNYAVQIDSIMEDTGTGDNRHLVAKMELLQTLIHTHKINDSMYDAKKIANYCVTKLDNDDSGIKALGYTTLLR